MVISAANCNKEFKNRTYGAFNWNKHSFTCYSALRMLR